MTWTVAIPAGTRVMFSLLDDDDDDAWTGAVSDFTREFAKNV